MNFAERAAYGVGRIIGTVLHEAFELFWPQKLATIQSRLQTGSCPSCETGPWQSGTLDFFPDDLRRQLLTGDPYDD